MIRKLKIKFIVLSMTALLGLLTVIVSGMNIISYNSVIEETDQVLSLLSKNKGRFPEPEQKEEPPVPKHMSPEVPYDSRYFWVLLDDSGNIIQAETSKIKSVSTSDAIEFANTITENRKKRGFIDIYRYDCFDENGSTRITFLECRRELTNFRNFLSASIIMAASGYIIFFFVILFFSGRIIKPVSESYDKQKRFITDAGHEIKTPLTIINANADLLEMEYGENECIDDILDQTKRLTNLTNDLVYLARMEESEGSAVSEDVNLSELLSKAARLFKAPALTKKTDMFINIQPDIIIKGESRAVERLVNILIDNALKYSPCESIVSIDCRRENRYVNLHIVNSSVAPINKDELLHVFDRFYRTDTSRSSETGGHGIGLSAAKAIVAAHKGKIEAWTPDGNAFHITVLLPLQS